MIRPMISLVPGRTIWLASSGTRFGSVGCNETITGAAASVIAQPSSGFPAKSALSSLTSEPRPVLGILVSPSVS